MAGLTERAMARTARAPFPDLVDKLHDPGLTPYRLPGVERLTNTLEYFVHHEDLRRAQPGGSPGSCLRRTRTSSGSCSRGRRGWRPARPASPSSYAARDRPGQEATVRRGDDPVVVTGRPSELVLFFFGRHQLRDVTVDGPPAAVSRLREADKGF